MVDTTFTARPLPWWAGRLGAAFVTVIFIGLVGTPFFFLLQERAIRGNLHTYVTPAYFRAAEMQTSLADEVSAIIGFQANGESRFRNLYKGEAAEVDNALKQLSALTAYVGPDAEERRQVLLSTIARWHATVAEEGFLTEVMDHGQFAGRLFETEAVLDEALIALRNFQSSVQRASDSAVERMGRNERLNFSLTTFLGTMALLALLLIWRLANYSRNAERQLAEAAQRQENLARHAKKRQNEAEDAVRSRDELLRFVSHDLRNPLTNIALTASMLGSVSDFSTDDSRRLLDIIKHGTDRMNSLVRDLVEIGKMEAAQEIPLNLTDFRVDSLLQEACVLSQVICEKKKITLSCRSNGTQLSVHADRDRILQVLTNLIDNAVKFTPEGGTVTVACREMHQAVSFSVADTGMGIAQEHLPLIFERYWQRPGSERGTGLGLAIAKRFVERHGGRIWAESKPGEGTTFSFVLPQRQISN
jgi:signal transduction histidine kinase